MKKRIALVTAGPTRERLDSVRFLSNASSGKMGLALAAEFKKHGFSVTLILGPGIQPPPGMDAVSVVSAEDMRREVLKRFPFCDVFVSCAAVSDFRPKTPALRKIHRSGKSLRIDLIPNPDILFEAGLRKKGQISVGFALEEVRGLRKAREKMIRKNCDLMVLNDVKSMESDFISGAILHREGTVEKLSKISKKRAAQKICRAILLKLSGKF